MKKIMSLLTKADKKYHLIDKKDKIAVGISGGKDSLVLLKALAQYQRYTDNDFDLVAVTIDISGGRTDYSSIQHLCDELGVPYVIERTDIQQIVFDIRHEKNPCSLCAKMRRGALNTLCQKYGCNKLALGHHLNDVADTFMLSMLYEGRLSTMQPKSHMSKANITLIRPLYLTDEKYIKAQAKTLPVLESACPANKNTQREYVKNLIKDIQRTIPEARDRISGAIINTDRYNLL